MFRRTQRYDIIYGLRQSKGSGTQDNISGSQDKKGSQSASIGL